MQWSSLLKPYLAWTVWSAWRYPGRQQDEVYWIETVLEHLGEKVATSGTREHCAGAWRRQLSRQVCIYASGDLSTPAFLLLLLLLIHIATQKPNVPRSRVSHPEKHLEGTLSDLASAGTLTLYNFHEPLAKSHTPAGSMESAVLGNTESLGRPQTSPCLHPAPTPSLGTLAFQ